MTDLRVSIDFGVVPATIKDHPFEVIRRIAYPAVVEGTEFLSGRLALATPVGATGKARQGVVNDTGVTGTGDIAGHVNYAQPVGYIVFADQGTRPHWPPYAPIAYWARRVLGDERAAYPIMRKIAREGTKGKHFVERTAADNAYAAAQTVARSMQRHAAQWVKTG